MIPRSALPAREWTRRRDAWRLGGLGALLALALGSVAACRRSGAEALHVVWSGDVLSLDPNAEFEFATDTVAMNVFEPLIRYDRRLAFTPVLAESWDIADGRTWRFRLREGVTFHDGSPLTAGDVVFTIERVRASARSDIRPFLAGVTSARALDARTVEVVSERPADLLHALSYVYVLPKKALTERGEKKFFERPDGTGPYRLVRWLPHKEVALSRYGGHRDPAPRFSEVVFLHERNPEAMWQAARDAAPAIILGPTRSSWNAHQGDKAFTLVTRPGLSVEFLACNMRPGSPLADVRVRRALRAAIDYGNLAEKVSGGQAFAASQLVTPDIFGFDPEIAVPVFEPGLAKRLLAEAGYPGGLDLKLNAGEGPTPLTDELIRELGVAGVRVSKEAAPVQEFFRRFRDCEPDLHVSGWFCSTGDASELLEGSFTSGRARRKPTPCGYASPELDGLVDDASRTLDGRARRALLQQAMRRLVEDLPWIPLLVPYDRYAMTKGVSWEPWADGEVYLPEVRGGRR